ncbi:MAG TPA: hypothetical protein VGC71_02800 [Gaiellales bacterium]|jgi:hypothetical protein
MGHRSDPDGERRVRDDLVEAARQSDRSHTVTAPEPPLPPARAVTDEELDEVVEAAKQRSPTTETGQAG